MFGLVKGNSAQIENLGLTNVNITGEKNVAAIVGNNRGNIYQCYASGNVNSNFSGNSNTGGMTGENADTIKNSFSKVNVTSGGETVGGITGRNNNSGLIKNCYSHGEVSGDDDIGGIVGYNYKGKLKFCYSTSPVNGDDDVGVGGIVGYSFYGTIQNSFWNTETSGHTSTLGTGKITVEMQSPYTFINEGWDFMNETNNGEDDYWGINPDENGGYPFLSWEGFAYQIPFKIKTHKATNIDSSSAKVIKKILAPGTSEITSYGVCWDTTAAPTLEDNYTDEGSVSDTGTFASNITGLKKNTTYYLRAHATNSDTTIYGNEVEFTTFPSYSNPAGDGTEANPYQIANLKNLTWLMAADTAWDKHYIQTTDIDASATESWYSGEGFIPIGNSNTNFTGTYNGQHHKIDSLYINRGSSLNIGLFGLVKGDLAQIENLGVTNVNITGEINVAAIVGHNRGNIYQCYASGNVNSNFSGDYSNTGGITGINVDTIKNSFSKVNVTSEGNRVGGITGRNNNSGLIINCYSHGEVSGDDEIGGIVGSNYKGKLKYCYSTSPVNSDYFYVSGIVGKYYNGTIQNSFWDTETSGQSSGGGTGLSTSEMQDFNNYIEADWDFLNTWGFNPAENNGYPFLKWQGIENDFPLAIKTEEITNKDYPSAKIKGLIFGLDNSNLEAHGACWNASGTPTIADDTTNKGGSVNTDTIRSEITGLEVNNQYHVRTYLITNDTTIYSNEVTFITLKKELNIGGNFTVEDKEYDGTTDATITENNLALEGIIDDEEAELTNVSAVFAQAEEGMDITVTIDTAELEGADTANYCLSLTDAPTTKADITEATGINHADKAGIKLYPNPFQDYIIIESEREIIKVEITAMSGITRIVENPENRINTSKLEKGVYLIILEDAKGNRYHRKVIRK